MENKDIELNERISEGEKFLLKLQRYNRNEFDKDIYIVDTFIPYKYSKSFDQMKDDFENWRKTAEKEMNSNNYLGATFTFQYIFLYNFFHYNLPAEVSSKLTDALLKSSGKPWKEAAETLWKAMNDILSGNLKVKSKHGFFRKLFR